MYELLYELVPRERAIEINDLTRGHKGRIPRGIQRGYRVALSADRDREFGLVLLCPRGQGRYAGEVSPRQKLLVEALALPASDRRQLARELLDSLDPVELSADDLAELDERMAAVKRGEYVVVEDIDGFIDSLDAPR